MGMFDTVKVRCPKCGKPTRQQTKTGACRLEEFELRVAPQDVLRGLDTVMVCGCGTKFQVIFTPSVEVVCDEKYDDPFEEIFSG